jgi:hypothetical protein
MVPESFHKKGEQLDIDFEAAEFKDSSGRTKEQIIKECHLEIILKDKIDLVYFDPEKKEWRVKYPGKEGSISADDLYSFKRKQEKEDDIETNSGWHR